jgi:hypothetical protein
MQREGRLTALLLVAAPGQQYPVRDAVLSADVHWSRLPARHLPNPNLGQCELAAMDSSASHDWYSSRHTSPTGPSWGGVDFDSGPLLGVHSKPTLYCGPGLLSRARVRVREMGRGERGRAGSGSPPNRVRAAVGVSLRVRCKSRCSCRVLHRGSLRRRCPCRLNRRDDLRRNRMLGIRDGRRRNALAVGHDQRAARRKRPTSSCRSRGGCGVSLGRGYPGQLPSNSLRSPAG